PDEMRAIIDKCKVMRLALFDGERPYIVPLNFAYKYERGKFIFYFHSAKEGKKISLLQSNPNVCLELDTAHELTAGETPCKYGYNYQSVIASGQASFVDSPAEKRAALELLLEQQTGKNFDLPEEATHSVAVCRIDITEITAKKRQVQGDAAGKGDSQ
ncbi:MAG: pyridoxamine 5'-phosphate oxidase family protein, partial [Treponema sp.]